MAKRRRPSPAMRRVPEPDWFTVEFRMTERESEKLDHELSVAAGLNGAHMIPVLLDIAARVRDAARMVDGVTP